MADEGYLLDNQQSEAGRRFGALAALFDGSTFDEVAAALPTYLTMLGS